MTAILGLIAAFGWGTSDFAAGTASRRTSAEGVVLFTHLIAACCLLPVAAFAATAGTTDLFWGATAGVGGALGALLLYRGLARGKMAVVAPVTAAGAASVPVIFGMAQGESLGWIGLGGILTALGAIVLMSFGPSATGSSSDADGPGTDDDAPADLVASETEPRDEELVWRRPWIVPTLLAGAIVFAAGTAATPAIADLIGGDGLTTSDVVTLLFAAGTLALTLMGLVVMLPVMLPPRPDRRRRSVGLGQPGLAMALLAGVGFGLFFVALSRTSSEAGVWPLVSARFTSVVLFGAAALLTGLHVVPAPGSRRPIVFAGAFDALAAVCFLLAAQSGMLSVAAVLSSLYPGVTVLLARVFTQERCGRTQLAGMTVAAVAVGMLTVA